MSKYRCPDCDTRNPDREFWYCPRHRCQGFSRGRKSRCTGLRVEGSLYCMSHACPDCGGMARGDACGHAAAREDRREREKAETARAIHAHNVEVRRLAEFLTGHGAEVEIFTYDEHPGGTPADLKVRVPGGEWITLWALAGGMFNDRRLRE